MTNRKPNRGFTLTELLVVIGVIVLIVTLAVPAFNAISGNRSVDAAQNTLAAMIGRARQEAIGLEDYRGVIMFQDFNTGRACAAEIYYAPPNPVTAPPLPTDNDQFRLELTPNHDELLLPRGIGFRMVEPSGGYSSVNVIMFDGRGCLACRSWTVAASATGRGQALRQRLGPPPTPPNPPPTTPPLFGMVPSPPWPLGMPQPVAGKTPAPDNVPVFADPAYVFATSTNQQVSALGFILFPDEGAYRDQYTQTSGTTYMTDNGITFFVNRYSGTLLRSE